MALVVLEQRVRNDAVGTLRYFAAQDVTIKMISGDSAVERTRGGFVARVLRMALPAGAITAIATFSTYLLVVDRFGTTDAESRTAAVLTLFLAALWVLAIVCRPYNGWKIAMLVIILACMVYDLLNDWTRAFFALDPSNSAAVLTSVLVAGTAMVLLEVAWWLNRSGGPDMSETSSCIHAVDVTNTLD